MIITFLLIWGLLFISHIAYSYKFLYRRSFERPSGFYGVRLILFFLHVITLIVLSIFLIAKGKIVYTIIIIIVTIAITIAMRKLAYNRVVNELFMRTLTDEELLISLQKSRQELRTTLQTDENASREESFTREDAKRVVNLGIQDGTRSR